MHLQVQVNSLYSDQGPVVRSLAMDSVSAEFSLDVSARAVGTLGHLLESGPVDCALPALPRQAVVTRHQGFIPHLHRPHKLEVARQSWRVQLQTMQDTSLQAVMETYCEQY